MPSFHPPRGDERGWEAYETGAGVEVEAWRTPFVQQVESPAGILVARAGDWLIRLPSGAVFPVSPSGFRTGYRRVGSRRRRRQWVEMDPG